MARVTFVSPMTGGKVQVDEEAAEKYRAAGWVLVTEGNKAGAARVAEAAERTARRAAKKASREQRTPAQKAADTRKAAAKKTAAPTGGDGSNSDPENDPPTSLTASLPNPDPDAPGEKASENTVSRADAQDSKED